MFQRKIGVHCPTEDDARRLCAHYNQMEWVSYWKDHKERSVYSVESNEIVGHAYISWYQDEKIPIYIVDQIAPYAVNNTYLIY